MSREPFALLRRLPRRSSLADRAGCAVDYHAWRRRHRRQPRWRWPPARAMRGAGGSGRRRIGADEQRASPAGAGMLEAELRPSEPNDYVLPAMEIVGFDVLLNRFNRDLRQRSEDYAVTLDTIRAQPAQRLGHRQRSVPDQPVRPSVPGLDVLRLRALGGPQLLGVGRLHLRGQRVLGDLRRETRPSGTTRWRAASAAPSSAKRCFAWRAWCSSRAAACRRPWREVAAAAISPSTGFNRLVFGDRYGGLLEPRRALLQPPGRRLQRHRARGTGLATTGFKPNEAQSISRSTTACPASLLRVHAAVRLLHFPGDASSANGFENVMTRGLLVGRSYEAGRLPRRAGWTAATTTSRRRPFASRAPPVARHDGHLWLTEYLALEGTGALAASAMPRWARCTAPPRRPRLQLRRHAAGTARAAPDARRQARRSTSPGANTSSATSASGTMAATTTSSGSTRR